MGKDWSGQNPLLVGTVKFITCCNKTSNCLDKCTSKTIQNIVFNCIYDLGISKYSLFVFLMDRELPGKQCKIFCTLTRATTRLRAASYTSFVNLLYKHKELFYARSGCMLNAVSNCHQGRGQILKGSSFKTLSTMNEEPMSFGYPNLKIQVKFGFFLNASSAN